MRIVIKLHESKKTWWNFHPFSLLTSLRMLPSIANASNQKFLLFLSILMVSLHHPLYEGLCSFVGNAQRKTPMSAHPHLRRDNRSSFCYFFGCFSLCSSLLLWCFVTCMWLFVLPLFLKNISLDNTSGSSFTGSSPLTCCC